MLLTEYSNKEKWYCPYVEEILAGIVLDDIVLNENDYFNGSTDIVLNFSMAFCNAVYNKLLESNSKADINIYLVALKISSYNCDFIFNGIFSIDERFFLKRPALFMLLFSRDNMFKYVMLRKMYEDWHFEG